MDFHAKEIFCKQDKMAFLVQPFFCELCANSLFHASLSRLSDYLFVVARYAARKEGRKEKVYTRTEP